MSLDEFVDKCELNIYPQTHLIEVNMNDNVVQKIRVLPHNKTIQTN